MLAAPFKDGKFKKDQSVARFVSQRAKMWGRYHLTRTSVEFKTLWCTFIKSNINCAATPTLYQFITDIMFKKLVEQQLQVGNTEEASACWCTTVPAGGERD